MLTWAIKRFMGAVGILTLARLNGMKGFISGMTMIYIYSNCDTAARPRRIFNYNQMQQISKSSLCQTIHHCK